MILGFTFLSPLNLFFLPLIALPVIIHLLNRRRWRRVRWAAMEFLLKAMRKQRRRLRIENFLLLLLRMAAIACLVFACSMPISERASSAAVHSRNTCLILAVDTSYSMAYQEFGGSILSEAMKIAKDKLAKLKQSDRLIIIRSSEYSEVVFDDHVTRDARLIAREFIDSLKPSHTALNVSALFTKIQQKIDDLSKDKLPVEVIILTDLQVKDWLLPNRKPDPKLKKAFALLHNSGTVCLVYNLSTPNRTNFGIVDARVNSSIAVVDVPVVLRAVVKNWSYQNSGNLTVDLLVDGHKEQGRSLEVSAGSTGSVVFRNVFRDPGVHAVSFELRSDKLSVDNKRFLAVNVRKKINVLLVDGNDSMNETEKSTFFLDAALSRDPGVSMEVLSPFKVEAVPSRLLSEEKVLENDVVVLSDVSRFSGISDLKELLNRGGGVLVFLGPNVDMDSYNETLFNPETGICPVRLLGISGDPTHQYGVFMEPEALDNPVIRFVVDREEVSFSGIPVWRFYRSKLGKNAKTLVLFKDPGKNSAIVEASRDQGSVIVVMTTADDQWTNFPKWPDFVSILYELLAYQVSSGGAHRNLFVGWPFRRLYPAAAYAEEVKISSPDRNVTRTSLRGLSKGSGGNFQLLYERTDKAGFYDITLFRQRELDPIMENRFPDHDMFAVNLAGEEGDLTSTGKEELKECYGEVTPVVESSSSTGKASLKEASLKEKPEFWFPLLIGMLLFFISEAVCATFFGRRQR